MEECKFCGEGRVARNSQGECYVCVTKRVNSGIVCSCGRAMYDRETGLCRRCLGNQQRLQVTCKHCAKNRPVHAKTMCRSCYESHLKKENPEYHERTKEYQREKRKEPTAKAAAKARNKARWADPEYVGQQRKYKWDKLLARYGLTQQTYDALTLKGCELCGAKEAKQYHLDHDHNSGQFRGLLCSKCNNGLGMLGDNIEGLEKALKYLQKERK